MGRYDSKQAVDKQRTLGVPLCRDCRIRSRHLIDGLCPKCAMFTVVRDVEVTSVVIRRSEWPAKVITK